MVLEKRYQILFGTKKQIVEIAIIIEQFPKIKATILEHKIILPRTTPDDDDRVMYFYELELTGPLVEFNKYFEVLAKSPDCFFNESTNLIS